MKKCLQKGRMCEDNSLKGERNVKMSGVLKQKGFPQESVILLILLNKIKNKKPPAECWECDQLSSHAIFDRGQSVLDTSVS